MLPELTPEGDLPVEVHLAAWEKFRSRFGTATLRREWLFSRLQALVALASSTGKLRREFIWGSFVTAKPSPGDLDVLLIMSEDFEVESSLARARPIFDSVQARLRFQADVFWARESIGSETLQMWLETYQVSRAFRKRGIVELELP
jgi:hypothetical protein